MNNNWKSYYYADRHRYGNGGGGYFKVYQTPQKGTF